MLKFYLVSIIVWFIMIYGTAYIFEDKIKENGWMGAPKSKKNPYIVVVLSAMIPVIRAIFFVSVLIMIGMTKEKWEETFNNDSD